MWLNILYPVLNQNYMEGRSSALDTSRTSRTSSAKGSQLPPLWELKSNILDLILSSKGTKLNNRDPSVERPAQFNRMIGSCTERMILKRTQLSDSQRLLRVVLTRCKKISQAVQTVKGREDVNLIKHLKASSCVKIALENIFEKMTRKGQIGADLKGVNNQILQEIQKDMLEIIQKQAKLFRNQREYTTAKVSLRTQLTNYKRNIMQEIENLRIM